MDDSEWPEIFRPTLISNQKPYLSIDESLLQALGVKVHVKNKGYKALDHILENHGKKNLELSLNIYMTTISRSILCFAK